jgi:hypothetical protein
MTPSALFHFPLNPPPETPPTRTEVQDTIAGSLQSIPINEEGILATAGPNPGDD